jgi:hypothetical protein
MCQWLMPVILATQNAEFVPRPVYRMLSQLQETLQS